MSNSLAAVTAGCTLNLPSKFHHSRSNSLGAVVHGRTKEHRDRRRNWRGDISAIVMWISNRIDTGAENGLYHNKNADAKKRQPWESHSWGMNWSQGTSRIRSARSEKDKLRKVARERTRGLTNHKLSSGSGRIWLQDSSPLDLGISPRKLPRMTRGRRKIR